AAVLRERRSLQSILLPANPLSALRAKENGAEQRLGVLHQTATGGADAPASVRTLRIPAISRHRRRNLRRQERAVQASGQLRAEQPTEDGRAAVRCAAWADPKPQGRTPAQARHAIAHAPADARWPLPPSDAGYLRTQGQ